MIESVESITGNFLFAILVVVFFWLFSYFITIISGFFEKKMDGQGLSISLIRAGKLPIRFLSVLLGIYAAVELIKFDFKWKQFNADTILYILIVLVVCFTLSRTGKAFFGWHAQKRKSMKVNKTALMFMRKAISVCIYIIGILVIFKKLGVEIAPILAGLGVAGIAVALALQQTLSDVFAAFFFLADKTFNIGDFVQLEDGTRAKIVDISWRSTKLRTIDDNTVILPNSKFVNQKISSYDYKDSEYYTSITVGVAYNSDLDLVEEAVTDIVYAVLAKEGAKIAKEPIKIRFKELAESSISVNILVRVPGFKEERKLKSEIIKEVIKEFRLRKIEIPFPQRVITMGQVPGIRNARD